MSNEHEMWLHNLTAILCSQRFSRLMVIKTQRDRVEKEAQRVKKRQNDEKGKNVSGSLKCTNLGWTIISLITM